MVCFAAASPRAYRVDSHPPCEMARNSRVAALCVFLTDLPQLGKRPRL